MSFEPRMRGRRFRRPAGMKKSARERREQQGSIFYEEASPIDPSEIRSVTLNSLQHLGNQRFPLPPYYDHFQRWMKDITALLSDFENQLPEAVDQQFKGSLEKTLTDLQLALKERTYSENNASSKLSDAQRQLAARESELSKLDHEYKNRTHDVRRRYERDLVRLSREIETLDAERLRILHAKPSILQKLFHRSETNLEERANALRSKKNALADRKEALTRELEKQRTEYERKREQVTEQLNALRTQLGDSKGSKLDDALDIREVACGEMQKEVSEAVDRLLGKQGPPPPEGKT